MKMKNTIKSFVKEFQSVLKGDSTAAQGEKALRSADSALSVAIATKKGDTIALEDALEAAKENLRLARVNNGTIITNRELYISNLICAKNKVTEAEEAQEAHGELLTFLQKELNNLNNEEEEEVIEE